MNFHTYMLLFKECTCAHYYDRILAYSAYLHTCLSGSRGRWSSPKSGWGWEEVRASRGWLFILFKRMQICTFICDCILAYSSVWLLKQSKLAKVWVGLVGQGQRMAFHTFRANANLHICVTAYLHTRLSGF